MIYVTLFTREGCQLCEAVKRDLQDLRAEFPHELVEIDIDSNSELSEKFALEIPVVEIGPYKLKAPISRSELQMTLGAATDRQNQIAKLESPSYQPAVRPGGKWTDADRISYWISRHYLAVINIFVLVYVGLPFLAPVLMQAGLETPAKLIYRSYKLVCHELAYRSFFLFGEQAIYPRQAAGFEGLLTFNQATGLSEGNNAREIFAAEDYVGDPDVGFKVALCQRDVAIYLGIVLFSVVFVLSGRRLPQLPWYLWLAFGILPIAVDGFSQLFSQPPLGFIPYRESTVYLRILTGGMFGFFTAWFGIPMLEESMAETRKYLENKRRAVSKIAA
ncbi:MAG: hypothetical protein A2Z16_02625 [Chloroflexi bacterium RBG_16_54_18]|nr:MAG: hypothetical protein A2Z16_02625 [Chloroflexi bacterium RBG_16_54_18]